MPRRPAFVRGPIATCTLGCAVLLSACTVTPDPLGFDDCSFDTSACLVCQQFTEDCTTDADCCPGIHCDDDTCWP
ncbi:MAG: hypothetical protein IAG13_10735 [Deltaproteobacteria bacterium]|nr:hypothetical protein [Nannocystaceae bacterium]